MKYDDRGHVVELGYFGPDGKGATHRDGSAGVKLEFEGDKEIRRVYLDAQGNPIVTSYGYAERRLEYDRTGNQVLESFYDAAGKPQAQADGYAAIRSRYDECGHLIETSYLRTGPQPA